MRSYFTATPQVRVKVGADARVTSQTAQQPVVGFVLTNSGLMANLSLSGSRVTPLNLK